MNATDRLALARYCAWRMLDHTEPGWDALPGIDEDTYGQVVEFVQVVAMQLREQAGQRGRLLYEAVS